jgi:hypothetical protein
VGTEVEIDLYGDPLAEAIELSAVVCRYTPGRGMGVRFTDFRRQGRARLERLLSGLARERAS